MMPGFRVPWLLCRNRYEQQMSYDYVAGFEQYVKKLRGAGVKTALVTSSNQPKMQAVMKHHPNFHEFFDAILTAEDFELSKPAPDCYLKAAKVLETSIEDCVVFEDSFNGLKSGRAAGMYVVGLTTTNTPDAIRPYCDEMIENYLDKSL